MAKRRDWLIGLSVVVITFALIMVFAGISATKSGNDRYVEEGNGDKIGVIRLTGPIYNSETLVRQFQHFGRRSDIHAIVFRIDSPGGGVAASQEIYDAVKFVRDSGKPVVASMGSVAASGGYYVACGADSIIANPGTTTGSIGVIAQFVTMRELMEKIGIRVETIKSGPYKDTGSYHRDFSTADRRYLQSWVDDAYAQFTEVVAHERRLTLAEVKKMADGRVYTGRQAFQLGLVDAVGNLETAVAMAASLAGITGKPALVQLRRRQLSLFDLLFQQAEGMLRGANGMTLHYRMP